MYDIHEDDRWGQRVSRNENVIWSIHHGTMREDTWR